MDKKRVSWKSVVLVTIAFLIALIVYNTYKAASRFATVRGERLLLSNDQTAAKHLQQAVGIASISYDDSLQADHRQVDSLIGFLTSTYPEVFKILDIDTINGHSLLMLWKGHRSDPYRKPIILYAHMDVVPAETDSVNGWRFDAFPKNLEGDTIRGRGTIDDKLGVIGMLEATTKLLSRGFAPKRDIYFAFGHDEETGGTEGAAAIASELQRRGVEAEWMLDEGGMVAEGIVPFVKAPVALVMTAEKGYMTVDLSVVGSGGHSSFPPDESPIDLLAEAIVRLKESPMEATICETVDQFMDHVGPVMDFPFNALFANRWLFAPVILHEYEKIPEGNATIRTTMAWTMSHAGVKENVLPTKASVTANLRILPGGSVKSTLEAINRIINDDRISLHLRPGAMEPIESSDIASAGFEQISAAIRTAFPDAVVAPNLSIASTDSRHFSKVAAHRFRFLPVRMSRAILSGMHGKNERVDIHSFTESILFYESLLGAQ